MVLIHCGAYSDYCGAERFLKCIDFKMFSKQHFQFDFSHILKIGKN